MVFPRHEDTLGKPESVWIDTSITTHYPFLAGGANPDVIVVGGGIAGLTAAYLLQAAGIKTIVLEMRGIIQGVTGYTTAKVTALHTLIYSQLVKQFGEERAQMYGAANMAGLEKIVSLATDLGIQCDLKRTNAYTFAQKPEDVKAIEEEINCTQKLGWPTAFVPQAPIPIPNYGAITFSNQAQFHPRKYLIGLAHAFEALGGQIFEYTRVLSIDEDGTGCHIHTDRGIVNAPYAIIATNYPIYDLAMYFTRITPYRSLVLGVRLEGKAPEGMFIAASDPLHSFRNQPVEDGELLIIGGQNYKTGQGEDILLRYERLAAYAREHFKVRAIQYHWSTQDCQTPDGVPYIGAISPNSKRITVATGFNGWGMTNGTAAGILLSNRILNRETPWAEVYDPARAVKLSAAAEMISEGLNVARETVKGLLPKASIEEARKLPPGEGIIVQTSGEKLAVSCDAQGTLKAVSAVCTHMGCIVAWNNAEVSWDCPCHGSRFAADGTVLHGPATKNLEARPLALD